MTPDRLPPSALVLQTERLLLRTPGRDDHHLLRDLVADPDVFRFLGPRPADPVTDMFTRSLRGGGSWFFYGYGTLMAFERQTGAFVGQLGVFHSMRGFGKGMDDIAEAGWIVAKPYWGKGYAAEGMAEALRWIDTVHALPRTCCMIERGNTSSVKLAERLGYIRYDEHDVGDGVMVDLFERVRVRG